MIDHVFTTACWADNALSAGPLRRLGRRLQKIDCRHPKDHIPVRARLPIRDAKTMHSTEQQRQTWDRDKLMRGVRKGEGRDIFLSNLESQMEGEKEEWIDYATDPTPDRLYQYLTRALNKAGETVYSKNERTTITTGKKRGRSC